MVHSPGMTPGNPNEPSLPVVKGLRFVPTRSMVDLSGAPVLASTTVPEIMPAATTGSSRSSAGVVLPALTKRGRDFVA